MFTETCNKQIVHCGEDRTTTPQCPKHRVTKSSTHKQYFTRSTTKPFTSPTLRIPGLLQTKLLDRIGGPKHLQDGVLDALQNGNSITAKVPWLTSPKDSSNCANSANDGKPRWIHCTPLFGSDDKVGVWMVILVENEEVTGLLNRQMSTNSQRSHGSWCVVVFFPDQQTKYSTVAEN